jgi:ribosome-associated protein
VAEAKKGEDILVLDMQDVTLVADYFVIVSGHNVIQVESIADAVEEALAEFGAELLHRSGRDRAHWVLLDYGSVVVHVFTDQERAYYNLERLWGDARWVPRKEAATVGGHVPPGSSAPS